MKYFAAIFLLSLFLGIGNAQITISADQFAAGYSQIGSANIKSYTLTSLTGSGLGAIAKKTGAAISWDFSPFAFTEESTSLITVMAYPGGAALANDPAFTSATHVLKVSSKTGGAAIYEFLRLDQNGLYNLGATSDTLGGFKLYSYTPALQMYAFPLTYLSSWSSVSAGNSSIPGYSLVDSTQATVDGYGSLITPTTAHGKTGATPMSSTNDALRITMKTTRTTLVGGTPVSSSTSYQYEWVTTANHRVTMGTDNTQKITSVSYSAGTSSAVDDNTIPDQGLNLHLSSNPASTTETTLFYTMKNAGNAQVSLIDALGNNIQTLQNGPAQPGQNIIAIDPTKFSAGTYFIRVNAEGMSGTRKLIITK